MIRRAVVLLALCLGPAALAADDQCKRQCDETVNQCKDMCKKQLQKTAADKISFCQQKCKEFLNECVKTCRDEKDAH
jgi:hypothetical protein